MGPGDLLELLKGVPQSRHPDLLVPAELGADAGVLRVAPDLAIVQSTDFFPPMLADARAFGRIAAANALSDLYALGSRPVAAVNLLAVPKGEPFENMRAMLTGAYEIITEAGAVMLGGHTLTDTSVKFGLAVTGLVHPDRIVRHNTPQAGDVLVLTKPVGTAALVTAHGKGLAGPEELSRLIEMMTALNRAASEAMLKCGVHAATDVTGFGLLGHAMDMLSLGEVGYEISYAALPKVPGAEEYIAQGAVCGGTRRNLAFTAERVDLSALSEPQRLLINDSQTSGGLLIALPPAGAARLAELMHAAGYRYPAAVIGKVVDDHKGAVKVLYQ